MDLAAIVVLALVMLPALEARDTASRPGDAESHLEEQATVVPAEGLGAEDRRPRVGFGRGEQANMEALVAWISAAWLGANQVASLGPANSAVRRWVSRSSCMISAPAGRTWDDGLAAVG